MAGLLQPIGFCVQKPPWGWKGVTWTDPDGPRHTQKSESRDAGKDTGSGLGFHTRPGLVPVSAQVLL